MKHFDIYDIKVLNWFKYFAFTGALSLYIQSLNDLDGVDRIVYITKLKTERINILKYFHPNSAKGKFVKMAILYLPSYVLNKLFGK